MKGTIFDIRRFSIHDGPGIRTTVFLKGCPLSCVWCHNPESQSSTPDILYRHDRCMRCGKCSGVCPQGAVAMNDGTASRDVMLCTVCGTCADTCPSEATSRVGYSIDTDHLMAKIATDFSFFDESGGGVTFSGGEPLNQPEFLAELLDRCHEYGFHRAVDTSGYATREVLGDIARRTDLILFDIKILDPEQHLLHTGVHNTPILENLRYLSSLSTNIELRMPIIPGVTDTPENLAAAANFITSLPTHYPIRLLPHHRAAMSKYTRFGMLQKLPDLADPSPSQLETIAAGLRKNGLEVLL